MKKYKSIRDRVNGLKDVIRNPYSFLGGYEKALVTHGGGVVCHICAKEEYANILHSTRGEYNDGWDVRDVAVFIMDVAVVCDHCGTTLPVNLKT